MLLVGEHTLQHWCLILHMLTRWLVLWIKVWVLVFPISFFFFSEALLDLLGVLKIIWAFHKPLTLSLSLTTDSVCPFPCCHWIASKHQPTCKLRHGLVSLKTQYSLFHWFSHVRFWEEANRRRVCGLGFATGAQIWHIVRLPAHNSRSWQQFVWITHGQHVLWFSPQFFDYPQHLSWLFVFFHYFITVCNIKCANGGIM